MFMLNKICAIACILIFGVSAAQAARSTYNPMVPRQLKIESAQNDYTYGYSILSGNAIDTLEVPNRVVGWTLNYEIFDRYLLRPVAHGYAVLPQPVQLGVGNFFSNIAELNNTVNNLFIGEVKNSGISLTRFIVNSTMGFLGFIDVASQMGLDNKPMEMDTVLGKAGMDSGPFLMVPIYGPTTARAAHGDTADNWPYFFFPWYVGIGAWAVEGIHNRAQLIDQEGVVDNAIDPYVQTRDFYLMHNQGKVDPSASMQNEEPSVDESFLDEIDG